MAVGTPLAPMIIFYDDSNQESYTVAMQLRTLLRQQQVNCASVPYKDASDLSTRLPQYLILVYAPQPQRPPQVDAVIDKTLDLVVQRQMKSIIAVTVASGTPSPLPVSLPEKWASIPTYNANASDYVDKNKLIQDIWREARYVKLPYSQEESQASAQRPQARRRPYARSYLWSAVIVIACLLAVGVTGLILLPRTSHPTSSPAQLTALARKSTPGSGTRTVATPQATAAPNTTDQQKELTSATRSAPTVNGFQKGDTWTETTSCAYRNANYSVLVSQTGQYTPCLATGTGLSYKNFALQVSIDISGDAAGIIFRSSGGTYYRLAVNQIYTPNTDTPAFTLVLCSKGACASNSTNAGTAVQSTTATVDKKPIVLTIIVRDNNIDVYANSKFVTRFTDGDNTVAGQIGVYAADINNKTTANFSGLKIWSLDGK